MMTLAEMKKKTLSLIEELSPTNPLLTEDVDIQAKINYVINQVQNELARIKKIPKFTTMTVTEGEVLDFADVDAKLYQIHLIQGIDADIFGNTIRCNEAGDITIHYYVYPTPIADSDAYVFELSNDALELMPYGVAADLLKSDVSAEYGQIYGIRYEEMLKRLDPRYHTGKLTIDGSLEWGNGEWL